MMFFSDYERRMNDMLDYYKYYFRFMNIVGADIFVFHGGKPSSTLNEELYCERYSKLYRLGKEFGVTVAVGNGCALQERVLGVYKEHLRNAR